MKKFFITGTDTDVGKTLISTILTLALDGCYWKPIQTGDSDRHEVQRLSGLPDEHFFDSNYSLKNALSPDQAAKLENIEIDFDSIQLPATQKNLIVEGAGGVYAPINENKCMLDVMQKLQLPIILVARGKIGTINHSLLTIETLRRRQLNIYGIIFSGEVRPESKHTIEKWGDVRTLLQVPSFENMTPSFIQNWVQENKKNILEHV